jgi:hypothetical protein
MLRLRAVPIVVAVVSVIAWAPRARAQDAEARRTLLERASTPALVAGCELAAQWPGGLASRWRRPEPVLVGGDASAVVAQCVSGELPWVAAADGGDDRDRVRRYRAWAGALEQTLPLARRAELACAVLSDADLAFDASQFSGGRDRVDNVRYLLTACGQRTEPNSVHVPPERVVAELERLARLRAGTTREGFQRAIAASTMFSEDTNLSGSAPEVPPPSTAPPASPEAMALVILQGLADFLVSRAEQEVQSFVIEWLRGELCTPSETSGPEHVASHFLANTCALLGRSDDTRFAVLLGGAFQHALLADVLAMPDVAVELLPPEARELRLVLRLVGALLRGTDPFTVLDRLVDPVTADATLPPELRDVLRGLASGLAAARLEGRPVAPADLVPMLRIAVGHRPGFDARAAALVQHAVQWAEAVSRLARADATDDERTGPPPEVSEVVGAALLTLEDVLAIAGVSMTLPSWVHAVFEGLTSGDPARMAAAGARLLAALPTDDVPVPAGLVRLVSLGAELATARDREAVAGALAQFAAPVGSWRAKTHRLTVSLSGLLGVTGGLELAPGTGARTTALGGHGGLIGLVGIDVAGPVPSGTPNAPSLGAFFSLLDVGALVTLGTASPVQCTQAATGDTCPSGDRPTPTTADLVSPLQFVAPGAFFRVGLRDVPFVLGAGVSVLPWGRTLYWDDRSEVIPIVRVGAFVAVDITILPF